MKFPLVGGCTNNLPASATRYNSITNSGPVWTANESERLHVVSEDFTLTDFNFYVITGPGLTQTDTFTIRKNGSDTSAVITIADLATSGTWSGSVSFSAGDTISIKAVTSAIGSSGIQTWNMYVNTTGQKSLLFGGNTIVLDTATTNYLPIHSTTFDISTGATDYQLPIPTGGNFTKLTVNLDVAPGVGKSYDFYVRINNSTDNLNVQISGTNTSGSATGTISVSAGDLVNIKYVPTGSPTAPRMFSSLTFEPTINGESILGATRVTGVNSAQRFQFPQITDVAGTNATEASRSDRVPTSMVIKKLYVAISAAPGAAKSWAFTARDTAADTTLTTTISGAAQTTNNDTTHTVTLSGGANNFSMKIVPTGTPAAATLTWGFVVATTQPVTAATGGTLLFLGAG